MKKIIKPVASLKGKILQIKEIGKNEYIRCNQTYKTTKKLKVSSWDWIWDGISRLLSNVGSACKKI